MALSQRRFKTFTWPNYIREMMSAEKLMQKTISKTSSIKPAVNRQPGYRWGGP